MSFRCIEFLVFLDLNPGRMLISISDSQEWVDLWISISKVQEKIIELEKDAMDVLVARVCSFLLTGFFFVN